jgi:hypothetical protein
MATLGCVGRASHLLVKYSTKCENHTFVTFGVSLPLKGLIKVSLQVVTQHIAHYNVLHAILNNTIFEL